MTLARLAVSAGGGFWSVRQRAQTSSSRLVRGFWRRVHDQYLREHGSFIGLGAEFAGPAKFPHGPFGIFVSNSAVIGRNCILFQHVTIGSNNLPGSASRGAPTLGDGCMLGAGAVVIGRVSLGDGVRVGAGCAVASDVPAHAVVVSQPPRVIQKERLDNRFVKIDA